jgi:hypothetical protein
LIDEAEVDRALAASDRAKQLDAIADGRPWEPVHG